MFNCNSCLYVYLCFGLLSCWGTHDLHLRLSLLTLDSTFCSKIPCNVMWPAQIQHHKTLLSHLIGGILLYTIYITYILHLTCKTAPVFFLFFISGNCRLLYFIFLVRTSGASVEKWPIGQSATDVIWLCTRAFIT